MALLNRVSAETKPGQPPPTAGKQVNVSLDIGRTLAVVLVGLAVLVISAFLYTNGQPAPAAAFFGLGEAVVTGGLGFAAGERNGAQAAGQALGS